jgi:hypothetical protein
LRVAEIGQRGKAPVARYAEPSAALLQIAPGEHLRMIVPPVGRRRRARIELVAVSGDDEAIVRVRLYGEQQQAHAQSRSNSLMLVFARVFASTCLTMMAQYKLYLPSAEGRLPETTTEPGGILPYVTSPVARL